MRTGRCCGTGVVSTGLYGDSVTIREKRGLASSFVVTCAVLLTINNAMMIACASESPPPFFFPSNRAFGLRLGGILLTVLPGSPVP